MDQVLNSSGFRFTRRANSYHLFSWSNQSRRDNDGKRCNEPVDQEGPDKRLCPIGYPAKGKATEDSGQGLNFRFADVGDRKWDGLQPESLRPKFARVAEQDPAAEHKFPADEVKESRPWQAQGVGLVILLHRRVTLSQIINDRSHAQNANSRNDQPGFPIAQPETKLLWVFAKEQQNNSQRNNEIENDTVPIFRLCELMIVIHHNQQCADDGNRDDFPVKV